MADEEFVDPLIGAKLGPCRVEERLAAGGMGVVYRARHTLLDQDVAVKILAPSLASDQEYVTRFFREAGAAGQIDHPNVIRVIDTERRLSLERATKFTREIASGLAAAHRAGIIHRDVKPGNIIVSPDGKPHLTDFGLARHAETRKGLTVEGTFLGTPEYASPEQVEGKKLDHRTDLYSLGVTYYQLLSGTLPFLGESPMEIAIKRTKEDPRPLENAFPGADARSCSIVKKLLQLEPGHRYQSATDLIRDLDGILQGPKSVPARSPETTKKAENVVAAAKARRRMRMLLHWVLVLGAVVLAFLSGGLADRGGACLERWAAHDDRFGARCGLVGLALLMAAGALVIYWKDLPGLGRKAVLGFLLLTMLLGAVVAGAWIDRPVALGTWAQASATARAAAGLLRTPVNLLALGLSALFAGVLISFEREPGSHRVILTRLMVAAGLGLVYTFGISGRAFDSPVRQFMVMPELSIPLATATLLACFFGALLVTGYNFESQAKGFGSLLLAGAAVGIIAFAVLVPQAARPEPWTALLEEALAGIGRTFRGSGTLLAGVFALGMVERSVAFAGIRRQDRSFRRKF